MQILSLGTRVGDAILRIELRFDFCISGMPVKIIGNLPFNIASPLLLQFLRAYSLNQGL
jgi:16S rRNA A1518/A1519 N6-dimethyltransferase RsmA/KsgA/DIM1 with predicted DNA glycosylase/AP lyase activity